MGFYFSMFFIALSIAMVFSVLYTAYAMEFKNGVISRERKKKGDGIINIVKAVCNGFGLFISALSIPLLFMITRGLTQKFDFSSDQTVLAMDFDAQSLYSFVFPIPLIIYALNFITGYLASDNLVSSIHEEKRSKKIFLALVSIITISLMVLECFDVSIKLPFLYFGRMYFGVNTMLQIILYTLVLFKVIDNRGTKTLYVFLLAMNLILSLSVCSTASTLGFALLILVFSIEFLFFGILFSFGWGQRGTSQKTDGFNRTPAIGGVLAIALFLLMMDNAELFIQSSISFNLENSIFFLVGVLVYFRYIKKKHPSLSLPAGTSPPLPE
jgi:hypothetical protein